jgi:hypothetical protein
MLLAVPAGGVAFCTTCTAIVFATGDFTDMSAPIAFGALVGLLCVASIVAIYLRKNDEKITRP